MALSLVTCALQCNFLLFDSLLQDFTWGERMRAAGKEPETHFAATLRQSTKRQVDLDHESIERRFQQRQHEQEAKALRVQRAEEERARAVRKQQHKATLERSVCVCVYVFVFLCSCVFAFAWLCGHMLTSC